MVETEHSEEHDLAESSRSSLSWAAMLGVVLVALLLAAGFAYLLVHPFFRHPAV